MTGICCDPLPPSQKSTLKMLILASPSENGMHHNGENADNSGRLLTTKIKDVC